MQPSPSKVKEVKAWLVKASEDLDSAKILFRAGKATQWHQVLFFCQQTTEKAMKAFLTWHDTTFRWTHDLVEIGKQCTDIDPTLAGAVDSVKNLSDYAWEFRYPGEDPEPTKSEAKSGIGYAETFFLEILRHLPLETHPTKSVTKKREKAHPKRKGRGKRNR